MNELVRDSDRSSEKEFIHLVEAYQLPLLQLCFVYLQDKTLAEDAVQETFLKAYLGYAKFRKEASDKTWLSHIAINCCRDINKSAWIRRVDRRFSLDSLPNPEKTPSEEDAELLLAVADLPVRLREVVLLYYFQNMTTVEIADTLHISQQAVSARIARGVAKLKEAVGETIGGNNID